MRRERTTEEEDVFFLLDWLDDHCPLKKKKKIKHVLVDYTVAKSFWAQTKLATGVRIPQLYEATWAADLMSELRSRRDQAIIMCGM